MDLFLIFLAIGLVAADKLDRSYLPPPGSKYAGGNPGDLALPFEFSKIDYQTDLNKPFGILPKQFSSDIVFDNLSNVQTADNFQEPNRFNQKPTEIGTSISEPTKFIKGGPGLNTYTDDSYIANGVKMNDNNQENPINEKSEIEQESYNKNNNNQKPILHNQNGVNYPNDLTQYSSTPVLRTGQEFNAIPKDKSNTGRLTIDKPRNSVDNNNVLYGEEYFRSKIPPGMNMYKDSTLYGSQVMYRPDTITPAFSRDSSGPRTSDYISNLISNPIEISPQTVKSYLQSDSISLNRPANIYQEKDTPFKQGSQNINVFPSSIPKQDSTNLNYKRPERPQAAADRNAYIVQYKNVLTPEGFSYSSDTSNGIHADESGTATDGVKAKGSYSYTGDDGKLYTIKYTADENGFRPIGDHLPTPPPIPIEIQAALKQIASKQADDSDDGSYDERKYGYQKYQGKMDKYDPYLKDFIENTGKTQDDYNDFIKKPVDTNHDENVNSKNKLQTTRIYPSNLPFNRKTDINDNIYRTTTIPSSNNAPISENNNNIIKVQSETLDTTDGKPFNSKGYKVGVPELKSSNQEFLFKPEGSAFKNKEYNIAKVYVPKQNSSINITRYLPETIENKLSAQNEFTKPMKGTFLEANKKIIPIDAISSNSFLPQISTYQNGLQSKMFSNSETTPTTDRVDIYDGSFAKDSKNNGYYYNVPDYKETSDATQKDSTSSIKPNKVDNEYIPTLRTNYDEYYFPTTDDTVTPTEKYYNTYPGRFDDKEVTQYKITPSHYDEKIPSTEYTSQTTVDTTPSLELNKATTPYYYEYKQIEDENRPYKSEKPSLEPGKKFEYTQLQGYTTPISVDSYDGYTTSKGNYDNRISITTPGEHNTLNKTQSNVFTGYTYEKPNSYGNDFMTIYKEEKPIIFKPSRITNTEDVTAPNTRYVSNNRKENNYSGNESQEPNYYTTDNPSYEVKGVYNNANYGDQFNLNSPNTKERPNVMSPYFGTNNDNQLRPDGSRNASNDNSVLNNQKDSNKIDSPEISKYLNTPDGQISRKPINKENKLSNSLTYPGGGTNGPASEGTQKVIGEDFSGPKRPQSFDPATGYHY